MNYFSKSQAEIIRDTFQYLVGRPCFFNDIKEEAILTEIKVGSSGNHILENGTVQPGYYSLFCFDNSKVVIPLLFNHFNNFKSTQQTYPCID